MKYKYIFLLLFLPGIFFFSSCKKTDLKVVDDNSIPLYGCSEKTNGAPYICFDSLLQDSRCPIGGECVWSGTVIIQVTFHNADHSSTFQMAVKGLPDLGHTNDTTIDGYRIIFTDLKPYHEVNKPAPKDKDIKATFSITQ